MPESTPKLVAYVSDERYVALPDVILEFEGDAGSFEARSRATGAVHVVMPSGTYRVTLQKPGFGAKRVRVEIASSGPPHHFRLLSDALLGYAWPKWVKAGERAEFRVHSVEPYQLSLWRYGFLKVLVRNLGWFDEHGPRATMQITPDGDYSQTGVAWNKFGYANPALHQYVDAPEQSGLYYFHARTACDAEFGFPWIVAPSKPTSPIAVLASNITWNAYNNFGGRSNYINPDRLPPTPTVNARLELKRYTDPDAVTYDTDDYAPLSFDRPEPINHIDLSAVINDPIEGRAAVHIAPAEWRLLGWLEREQFAYDYYAETQLHDGTLDLDAYKVLIISTHPEYWSRQMYFAAKSWVHERGGKLMYLGGNGLNCEAEFVDPTTVIYKNGDARAVKGGGYESRFHARVESEAHLLGVVFSETGVMTAAPYRVLKANHWALDGTNLNDGDLFGHSSLHMRCPGGASGHETDKVSPSSPHNVTRLAKGTNVDDGGAELVYYETAKGGAVFSASSIAWPSAILIDDCVSRITVNVLSTFLS
ncbi:MAG TPA: N,N-dimethylformamidase beta subunit family domain-containing protein [Isosphaeraceae bacterium]|nr:N,N-dimethylformamidase beta subunit family domain-containing protein [Isosphaeraceae bacterium]